MRNTFNTLVSILISALFTYLAFRDVDLRKLSNQLITLPIAPIALCFAGQIATQLIHWIRWGIVIRRFGRVSWWRVFIIGAIGNAALFVLPARSGELVRPTLASSEDEIDFGQASATSVLERIVDGLLVTVILFMSLQILNLKVIPRSLYNGGIILFIFFLLVIAILIVSNRYQESIIQMLQGLQRWISPRWVQPLTSLFQSFVSGIRILVTSKILIPYLLISIILWSIDLVSIYWLFGIFSFNLPFAASFIVIAILALGKLIPSGPAQLGVFEFSIVLSLELLSVKSGEAILYATMFHVIVILSVLIFGVLGLWLNRIPRRRV